MKALILTTLLLIPGLTFASVPDFPMAFWGIATVDGVVAPAGAVVRIYDGTTKVGESTVRSGGVYGYTEPTKQKLVVGEASGVLTFSIQSATINGGAETQGLTVVTHPSFVSGETVNKNLAFTTQAVVTPPISSGGGGGGGGSKSKSKSKVTPNELVLGSATSTMSEADRNIALQKQIISLLSQLISLLQKKIALQGI
jgi:hypothetical protein